MEAKLIKFNSSFYVLSYSLGHYDEVFSVSLTKELQFAEKFYYLSDVDNILEFLGGGAELVSTEVRYDI